MYIKKNRRRRAGRDIEVIQMKVGTNVVKQRYLHRLKNGGWGLYRSNKISLKTLEGVLVPRSQSGAVPISSLLGVGSCGCGKLERVGQLGEGWGE